MEGYSGSDGLIVDGIETHECVQKGLKIGHWPLIGGQNLPIDNAKCLYVNVYLRAIASIS